MHRFSNFVLATLTAAAALGLPAAAFAQTSPPADLGLVDLLKVDVVTASRKTRAQPVVAAVVPEAAHPRGSRPISAPE